MNQIQLFCLPYAGGSTETYRKWKKDIAKGIDLQLIELSGRGKRSGEPFYDDLETAAQDVCRIIQNRLTGAPYAIFGHGLGSLIAYEVCHKINELNRQLPVQLFLSGCEAPHRQKEKKNLDLLTDAELKNELRVLGGTPEDYHNDEMIKYYLPIIRADYKIVGQYRYVPKSRKLESKIAVFNGTGDGIKLEDLSEWSNHTAKGCVIYHLKGGHFFIHDYTRELVGVVNSLLLPELCAVG